MNNSDILSLVCEAFDRGIITKLVFSRPRTSEVQKISARLCSHKGKKLLALELSLPGSTVSQKNIAREELSDVLTPYVEEYRQINLITTMGNAEYKLSKSGKAVVLGGDALMRKMAGAELFNVKLDPLDNEKKYILTGDEPFLRELGISSSDGRVHDKRQGKFRQINKFLEHIENLYGRLPAEGDLTVYDLCCGKSYLSFAVYYYLTEIKKRRLKMLGVDLKRDVIIWCRALAERLGYNGMRFEVGDISALPDDSKPDMVISLHACDIATDIVLKNAVRLGAKVILSTPCCHKYLSTKINADSLSFVTDYPHLKNKLSEVMTDALRTYYLKASGYSVTVAELTDPENTPKNTLIRAIKRDNIKPSELEELMSRYREALIFLLGEAADDYLKEFN